MTEIANALAEQFPVKVVSNEALAPGAKQSVKFLEDLLKTVTLVLLPLQVDTAS